MNKIEFLAQRPKMHSKPCVVDVVLTKACNFACTFCKDYETIGAKRISLDNFDRMASQLMPTAMRLNICSGGEPYLHTGLEEILRIARRYNPSLHTWVLSNGSILREARLRRIVDEGLITQHGFSVDGFKAETVESIRLNANLTVILDNIKLLLRVREQKRVEIPTVTIRYAAMRNNIEELPDAVRRWGDLGIDEIDVGYLSLANGMERQLSLYYHQEITEKYFWAAKKIARAYPKMTLNLPETIAAQKKYISSPKKCRAPWEFVMIDTNGQIMPCYRSFEALRLAKVYDEDGTPFANIWNSEQYRALRRTVNNDLTPKFYPYCAQCENRFGWSQERAHIGDDSWMKSLDTEWLHGTVNHKRPLKGTAAKEIT